MSTKNKNRHGRVGAKRSGRFGPTHKSDAYVHRLTIEESVATIPIAHRNINEAFSYHTVGTYRTPRRNKGEGAKRAKEREAREAARRDSLFGKLKKKVSRPKDDLPYRVDEKTADLLRSNTVAQLKKICDDNDIEYKSKDTKAVLLAKLGVTA